MTEGNCQTCDNHVVSFTTAILADETDGLIQVKDGLVTKLQCGRAWVPEAGQLRPIAWWRMERAGPEVIVPPEWCPRREEEGDSSAE